MSRANRFASSSRIPSGDDHEIDASGEIRKSATVQRWRREEETATIARSEIETGVPVEHTWRTLELPFASGDGVGHSQ